MFLTTMLLLPFVIIGAQFLCYGAIALIEMVDKRFPPATGIPVTGYPRLDIVQGHPVAIDTCVYCAKPCQFNPSSSYFNCWNCGCFNPVSGVAEWPMSKRDRTDEETARVRRWKRRFKITGVLIVLFVLAFIALFIYAATLPNTWST